MLPYLTAPLNRLRGALRRGPVRPPDVSCPLAHPAAPLPAWVAADPVVQDYRALLGDLPWASFPERPTARAWPGPAPNPRAPFVAIRPTPDLLMLTAQQSSSGGSVTTFT